MSWPKAAEAADQAHAARSPSSGVAARAGYWGMPPGSIAIEDLYESYYTLLGEPYDDTEFSGRSDYQPFIEAGIPSGGLFTGVEGVKTAEQAAIWGGAAGQQFDPCYHQFCDTFGNVNLHALEVNSDLIAFAPRRRPHRATIPSRGDGGSPRVPTEDEDSWTLPQTL